MALRYSTLPARRLTDDQAALMNAMADADAALASPFFRAEFVRTMAEVREGVEVVLIHDGPETLGFYSCERTEAGVGRPVGGGMSNGQGVIARTGTPWIAAHVARATGLRVLKFHHQIPEQRQFDAYVARREPSPVIDLAGGWNAYLEKRRHAGVSSFNALPRKMSRLERELGAITFVAQTDAADVFDRLIAWKRAQYAQGSLHQDWSVDVLKRLMRVQAPGFAGMLSALYAGSRLIAVHAGIRSRRVWHYWYPAYDPDLGRHSPGLVLLWEMCRWASDAGLERIDLGPGPGAHKDLFATSGTTVGVGEIVITRMDRLLSRLTSRPPG